MKFNEWKQREDKAKRNSVFLKNAEKRFFKGEKWEYKYEE